MLTDYGKYEATTPNDYYNELAQAFIDEQWDNGAAKTPENGGEILEQVAIGEDKFRCVEAWVKSTVGDVTTGNKDSRDFCKLYFRDANGTTEITPAQTVLTPVLEDNTIRCKIVSGLSTITAISVVLPKMSGLGVATMSCGFATR